MRLVSFIPARGQNNGLCGKKRKHLFKSARSGDGVWAAAQRNVNDGK